MPGPDRLPSDLRALAADLERESRPVDVEELLLRPRRGHPAPWRPIVAVVLAIVVIIGLAAVLTRPDPTPPSAPEPTGSTTSTPVPTTTSGPPPETFIDAAGLPDAGFAVTLGAMTTLYGFDGTELRSTTGPVGDALRQQPGRPALGVGPTNTLVRLDGDGSESPPGCEGAAGGGGLRVALCGGPGPQRRAEIVAVSSDGTTRLVITEAPGSAGVGHWRWAVPSPDGRWVLAQWSGECEAPAAYLIRADGTGVRRVDGVAGDAVGPDSFGIGWDPDGRAVVRVGSGECAGVADEPGVHLVDPDTAARTLVLAEPDTTAITSSWERRSGGDETEAVFERALRELGLQGCCGEPSHGGAFMTGGVRWQGRDVAVFGGPAGNWTRPDQLTPAELAGAPVLQGNIGGGGFVALACGGRLWSVGGGAGLADAVDLETVRALASTLLPHLYCTVSAPP